MRGLNTHSSSGLTTATWSTLPGSEETESSSGKMFFTRFVFTVSYRSGSQNKKAAALYRLYDTEARPMDQTPILPASCLVAPVVWELDADIEQA